MSRTTTRWLLAISLVLNLGLGASALLGQGAHGRLMCRLDADVRSESRRVVRSVERARRRWMPQLQDPRLRTHALAELFERFDATLDQEERLIIAGEMYAVLDAEAARCSALAESRSERDATARRGPRRCGTSARGRRSDSDCELLASMPEHFHRHLGANLHRYLTSVAVRDLASRSGAWRRPIVALPSPEPAPWPDGSE